VTLSLSQKLGDLKETLAEEFGVSSDSKQRLFYMGRELKSGGRSLSKLGLGKFSNQNNILHMHLPPSSSTSKEDTKDTTGGGGAGGDFSAQLGQRAGG
jgi:hypothetical protein